MTLLAEVTHRDPTCKAGFTAVTDRPLFGDRKTTVELRCWSCSTRIVLSATTTAVDDPETEGYRPPAEHAPFLATSWQTLDDLAASLPSERVGRIHMHPEQTYYRRETFSWLVADVEGNVLGVVQEYRTQRLATRWRWGLLDGVDRADGYSSPRSAAKALAAAAGLGGAR